MTRKQFRIHFIAVTAIYGLAILSGTALYIFGPADVKTNNNYTVFKDLIPFTVAIPAAYLGYCFQRRLSFLQSLKQLWTHLIDSVHVAMQYTHLPETTHLQYGQALDKLERTIDELRGVYKNKGETRDNLGLYTLESLKDIHVSISDLGYGVLSDSTRKSTREEIVEDWKKLRRTFLRELNRLEATHPDEKFVEY
jgi:hypothetical protein